MLTALALIAAALAVLDAARWAQMTFWPQAAFPASWVAAGLCGLGTVLAGFAALAGSVDTVVLPAGWGDVHLALDGLSAVALLPVLVGGTAAFGAGLGSQRSPGVALLVTLLMLQVLAADLLTLIAATEAAGLLTWLLLRREAGVDAMLAVALAGGLCLAAASGLLAPGGDLRFAAVRAAPPDGWHATLALGLVLAGFAGPAGLAPLHGWLPRAQEMAAAVAVPVGAITAGALYAMARLLMDLCGAATPSWWGMPLLALGLLSALLGAVRANLQGTLGGVTGSAGVAATGFATMGFGAALLARGADLPQLAALGTGAALVGMQAQALAGTLLLLGAGAVRQAAGSGSLARLGGVGQRMPVTALLLGLGAASVAALPPLAGFAGLWLLLQALIAGSRAGGFGGQVLCALLVAGTALAAALLAAAAARLVGLALLGRPRTPRAAAAEEATAAARITMAALAGMLALLGLLPAIGLGLAGGAIRMLGQGGMQGRAGLLVLAPAADAPGYAPPALVMLLALAGAGIAWAVRPRLAPGDRRTTVWTGGFIASAPWLPFGDPATQAGPLTGAEPVARLLASGPFSVQASDAPEGYMLRWHDPAARWLTGPLLRRCAWLALRAEPLHALPARGVLVVLACLLAALLGLLGFVGPSR